MIDAKHSVFLAVLGVLHNIRVATYPRYHSPNHTKLPGFFQNGGLDQYGAEPFEQQRFGTAGVERVKHRYGIKVNSDKQLVVVNQTMWPIQAEIY